MTAPPPTPKPDARTVVAALLDGPGTWLSIGQIARAAGYSHTTVRRALADLGAERQWVATAQHPHAIYRLVGGSR